MIMMIFGLEVCCAAAGATATAANIAVEAASTPILFLIAIYFLLAGYFFDGLCRFDDWSESQWVMLRHPSTPVGAHWAGI
jgi:hypothetical protein